MSGRAARRRRRRRLEPLPRSNGWVRFREWLLVVALVLIFVIHVGGGWYFSSQLRTDAFVPASGPPERDVEVVTVGEGQLSLRGDDPRLDRAGVFGVLGERGYSQVGEVLDTGDPVVRAYRLITGDAPSPGSRVALEGNAFPADPAAALGFDYEDITYPSPLGPMDAWLVRGTRSTWVIHVHGKGASRAEALRLAEPLHAAGFPQLFITYRNDPGQPADPSGYYRYGQTEWADLQAAVSHARGQGADEVVLVGFSTGAAVIMEYQIRNLDGQVAAAVFDSPNIDFEATVDHAASQRRVLGLPIPFTVVETAKFIGALRFNISWSLLDYVDRSGRYVTPTLVFHGTEDRTVPLETSRRFAEMRHRQVTVIEVEGADHVESWNADPATYTDAVLGFLAMHTR